MPMIKRISLLAATLLLAAPAFAQQAAPAPGSMMAPAPNSMMAMQANPGSTSAADTAMQAGMTKMQQDMTAAPMTGNADQDFVAMMLPHHQGAVDMAKIELQYGKDPEMRKLAKAIVAAQDREIAQMHRWQAAHMAK